MKASARPACGAIFRKNCRPRPAPACSLYSRAGYGASTPVKLPRPSTTCISRRSTCCRNCSIRSASAAGCLLGHSDGASIAAIYAGSHQDHRVEGRRDDRAAFHRRGVSVTSIAGIKRPMRPRSSRQNWRAGTRTSTTPSMAGTAPGSIQNSATGIFPNTSPISACRLRSCRAWMTSMGQCARSRSPGRVLLSGRCDRHPGAGHSPHREAPGATLDTISEFANAVLLTMTARRDGPRNVFPGLNWRGHRSSGPVMWPSEPSGGHATKCIF